MALEIQATKFAGEFAEQLIIPAIAECTTMQKGIAYFKDGIVFKENVGRIDFSAPFQPDVATPSAAGGVSKFTVSERELFPQPIMLYDEFDPNDYAAHVLGRELQDRIIGRGLPATAETAMMSVALGRAMEQLDINIWQSSLAFAATSSPSDEKYQRQYWNGLMQKILSTANEAESCIFIAGAIPLTSSNIIAQMQAVKNQAPKALLSKANRFQRLKFVVSTTTEQIMQDAYTNTSFKNNDTSERGIEKFQGYEVVSIYGLPDNTILFGEFTMDLSSNLWVGLNSKQDLFIEINRTQNNSKLWYILARMKFDTQIAWARQLVCYTTETLALYQ